MDLTYAAIELTNLFDEYDCERGRIAASEIRRWNGQMMVDTGAIRMAMNEEIRDKLGLRMGMAINASMADGTVRSIELIDGIRVRFGNRSCTTDAFVLPENSEPLLGAIALEGMDLVVIASRNTLEYNPKHPDGPVFSLN
jgi:clan AA aspartic protease